MLVYQSVTYRYPGAKRDALDGVSFTVAPGECVALLGANGSGKSTAVRLANALLTPSAGVVTVDGRDTADSHETLEIRRSVGMVFQRPDDQIVATAVEDDVAFGPENLGLPRDEIRRRVDEALATVGLSGLERREPHLLSGGQKQRLAVAGAIALGPRYLVLDEPTSMLDPTGRAGLLQLISALRDAGTGILHVTHDLSSVAVCDRVVVLDAGTVVWSGGPAELLARGERLAEWGLEAPVATALAAALRRAGRPVPPAAISPRDIVEALCP